MSDLVNQINPKMMITSHLDLVQTFQIIFEQMHVDGPVYIYENEIPGCLDLKPLFYDYFTSIVCDQFIVSHDQQTETYQYDT